MERKLPKIIVSAVIEKDGKFLLVKEVLESGKEYWIAPGGAVEFGETLEEALKREIKEETNLDIDIVKFIDFKEVIRMKFDYHIIIFFFFARPLNDNLIKEKNILDSKFFGVEEMDDLEIVDSARWLFGKHFKN